MSERVAFLEHIAEFPEADLPRLVFADWLEEQGDPLGELLRLQVELARRQDRLGEPDTVAMLEREQELLPRFWQTRHDWGELYLDRGLPSAVRVSNWNEHLDQLLEEWPTIQSFCPLDNRILRHLTRSPVLTRLKRVSIVGLTRYVVTSLRNLVESDFWRPSTNLRVLLLFNGNVGFQDFLQTNRNRLSQVEVVQAIPGPALHRQAPAPDDVLTEQIREFNQALGREIVVLHRPYQRFYPLVGNLSGEFFAGHLKSGAPTLFGIAPGGRRVAFCTFTEAGLVDKSLWEDTSTPPWTLPRLRDRFGFELGFIRVRQFEANNQLAVQFWPQVTRRELLWSPIHIAAASSTHLDNPQTFMVSIQDREQQIAFRTGRPINFRPTDE